MSGWCGMGGGWVRGVAVGVVAGGLVAGGVVPAGASVAGGRVPGVPVVRGARGVGVLHARRVRVRDGAAVRFRPVHAAWPAAGAARIDLARADAGGVPLTAAGRASAGRFALAEGNVAFGAGTPVWAQTVGPAGSGPAGVSVRVLGHSAAVAAGVRGVVFTARAAPGSAGGRVRVGVSYAGFAQVSGGDFGLGLGLVELPGCAVVTPRLAACERERPLASVNDAAARTVSAQVALPGGSGGQAGAGGASPLVLAAVTPVSDGGGPAGTYSATSLKPSGSWAAGGSSGSFTYGYPMAVPPSAGGLEPGLGLEYDSGAVDGQTSSSQAQASWVGDGWGTPASFIEQSFTSCADSPEGTASPVSSPDECYGGPVLTLVDDGVSTPLVCPVPFSYTTTSTCQAADDNGQVVTHHVSSGNGSGTKFTDYWTVTDRSGRTSYFGLNHLPGWASGDPATNSVDSVPVFSAHQGDPCYSSAGFGSSECKMAYRWNMDYVTDVHGNAMAYYYDQAVNAYAMNGNTASATSYVRDSYLDHIDYGFTDGNAYAGHAADEVVFSTGDRCFASGCGPLSASTAASWADVPYTQDYCAAGAACQVTGPSFWSTVRLASIATRQWDGSGYAPVDSWSLAQHFPVTGDGTSPALWLDSITQTGNDTSAGGAAVTLPAVTFAGTDYGNRVNPGNYPALDRYRITQITTETGAVISVTYELPSACSASNLPVPSADTSSCFPVYWQQFAPPTPDWFNKYAVASVSVADPSGGAPSEFTSYAYSGAAWHYDDNELVMPKYRGYGQWRGFQDVKTFTGTGTDARTESETSYYQGMDGDTLPGGGTRSVTLADSQGGQHVDSDQLAGLPLETTAYDFAGGPVDNSAISSYWVSAAAASRARAGLPALTANAVGQVESWSRQAVTDGGTTTWRKTETDTSYDATPSDALFGLPLEVFRHGDLSDASQQACTTTTYAPANTSKNLAGLPAEVETDAVPCGGSSPGGASAPGAGQVNALTPPAGVSRPAQVISDTRTFYDNPSLAQTWPQTASPAWPQAAPTRGEASVVQDATGYSGGAFTYQTKTATVYDSYGRPVTAFDANGSKTTTSYAMTAGSTTAQTVTNPLGQATTTSYDPLRGLPVAVTDPNGITTTEHYNGMGWLTAVWEAGRPVTSPASLLFSYSVGSSTAPTVVTTQKLNNEGGYATTTALLDALLRPRQTQAPTPQGGMLVTDDFYDSRGWQWKTNTSWWDSGATPGSAIVTVPDSQVPNQAVTSFDGLGRAVLVTSYDDAQVKSTTATAYYGDRVTTVPPAGGTPTSTVTDALGRTTQTASYTTPPTVTTSTSNNITSVSITGGTTRATGYSYNTRGELGTITDQPTGQQWTRSYNLLGQVTSQTAPSSGTTTMTYDPDGNLTGSTDAAGKSLTWTYDALGRKTGEYAGTSTSAPQLASFTYDNANKVSGVTNPVGQLTTETSYSGGNAYTIQQTGFNAYGESLGETDTLPPAEGALAGSYTLSHAYSAATGLPLRDAYPASPGGALPAETLTHGYETGLDLPDGLGSNLAAYAQNLTYTPFSQAAQEEIGTTTSSAYITSTYDPHTGALTDTRVQNTTAQPSAPYDDTSYTYDPAGNITAQTQTRDTPAAGTQAETQCYNYDTLGRLTQAWTATDNCAATPASNNSATVGDQIPGAAYWTTWQFDPLGNQTTQTQHSLTGGTDTTTSYTYNGNGAGQPDTLTTATTTSPSGTSTASYAYDADGNTTTRNLPAGKQTLTWTPDQNLATDTTPAGTTSYTYDPGGNLLLQKDPGQVTAYLFGGAQQLTLNTATGTITGTRFLTLPGGETVVRTGTGTAYNFEITDQHDTATLTLDHTAASPTWRQYTPYGAPRGTAPPSWPDNHAFLGKPADPATTLTTIGARQYDPATGRFISPDPLLDTANPQTTNSYAYAADNPVTNSDPTGQYYTGPLGTPPPAPPPTYPAYNKYTGPLGTTSPAYHYTSPVYGDYTALPAPAPVAAPARAPATYTPAALPACNPGLHDVNFTPCQHNATGGSDAFGAWLGASLSATIHGLAHLSTYAAVIGSALAVGCGVVTDGACDALVGAGDITSSASGLGDTIASAASGIGSAIRTTAYRLLIQIKFEPETSVWTKLGVAIFRNGVVTMAQSASIGHCNFAYQGNANDQGNCIGATYIASGIAFATPWEISADIHWTVRAAAWGISDGAAGKYGLWLCENVFRPIVGGC